MGLSPEPNWNQAFTLAVAGDVEQSPEEMLETLLSTLKQYSPIVVRVRDKKGNPLGSWTPKWFLSLDREHQLRFLTVAKRMHDGN